MEKSKCINYVALGCSNVCIGPFLQKPVSTHDLLILIHAHNTNNNNYLYAEIYLYVNSTIVY